MRILNGKQPENCIDLDDDDDAVAADADDDVTACVVLGVYVYSVIMYTFSFVLFDVMFASVHNAILVILFTKQRFCTMVLSIA